MIYSICSPSPTHHPLLYFPVAEKAQLIHLRCYIKLRIFLCVTLETHRRSQLLFLLPCMVTVLPVKVTDYKPALLHTRNKEQWRRQRAKCNSNSKFTFSYTPMPPKPDLGRMGVKSFLWQNFQRECLGGSRLLQYRVMRTDLPLAQGTDGAHLFSTPLSASPDLILVA